MNVAWDQDYDVCKMTSTYNWDNIWVFHIYCKGLGIVHIKDSMFKLCVQSFN